MITRSESCPAFAFYPTRTRAFALDSRLLYASHPDSWCYAANDTRGLHVQSGLHESLYTCLTGKFAYCSLIVHISCNPLHPTHPALGHTSSTSNPYLYTPSYSRSTNSRSVNYLSPTLLPRLPHIPRTSPSVLRVRLLDNIQELMLGFAHTGREKQASWSEVAFQGLRGELVTFAQRNPVQSLTIFGMHNVSPEFILGFSQMRSLSAFYVSITPNLAQEEEELGAEQGPSLASWLRPSLRKLMLGRGDTIGLAERFLLHPNTVFDVSQVAEFLLDTKFCLIVTPRFLVFSPFSTNWR
ncbi:hypothetical protein BKA70DRAFT_460245 [Coprinopsis sp. MPI-PUGE-AT-0042]|nr:hypothetical protein BKA70DRAFT_460245 [Coprinopsis sp. MPI-PUGE-AT-0042]